MGVRISGINAVVPKTIRQVAPPPDPETGETPKNVTGVETVRVATKGQTAVDLAEAAGGRLLSRLGLEANDVDGIVFVSQTPDYVLPASACILQHRLGLPKGAFAFDVGMGCSAYPYALAVGSSLITARLAGRVLVLVGDVLSPLAHPEDQGVSGLFGDAASATVLEWHEHDNDLPAFDLGSDGAGEEFLVVPVGRARYPTMKSFQDSAPDGLKQSANHPEHLNMVGAEIFSFTLREVPGVVNRVLERAGRTASDVDYFLFHQANRFILNHLIRKMKLSGDKCPVSIDEYGNTSGASPALTACHRLPEINSDRELTALVVGFGVGFSWGGALLKLRPGTLSPLEEV
jgi:3-oxoacyl-[acyl-carrier-protein] synthase-3